MGTTGSTPTPTGPSAQYGTSDPEFDKITSGVRITVAGESSSKNDFSNSDKIKEAYNRGKEDGKASFQGSLEQVAAQVYDGVHTRLTDIQTDGLNKSKALVRAHLSRLVLYLCFDFRPIRAVVEFLLSV